MSPKVVILSSPSGGGKTTIARTLAEQRSDFGISVSATTRRPRPGEQSGVAYHFVTPEAFRHRVDAGEFLEWAEYAGAMYGTLRAEVDAIRRGGRHALLDIEVQGARQVRQRMPAADLITIFVLPPDVDTWLTRLRGRATESPAGLARRLESATREIAAATEYEHMVVNDDLARAAALVGEIVDGGGTPIRRPADWHERITALRRAAAAAGGVSGGVA